MTTYRNKHDKHYHEQRKLLDWAGRLLYRRSDRKALSVDYLHQLYEQQQGKCYWTGLNIDTGNVCYVQDYGTRKRTNSNPFCASLDKLNPELGYVPGNVVITTYAANTARNNASAETFYTWLIAIQHSTIPRNF